MRRIIIEYVADKGKPEDIAQRIADAVAGGNSEHAEERPPEGDLSREAGDR
nr:hypothetical protein [Kibdelosporangium sp. MJ126-NF4]